MKRNIRFALAAFVLALPMGILFPAIVFELMWIAHAVKSILTTDGNQPSVAGSLFIYGGLLALPIAFVIAVWPMLTKDAMGKRNFYVVNFLLAVVIVVLMVPTWGGLLKDIYRCDILQIPNCD